MKIPHIFFIFPFFEISSGGFSPLTPPPTPPGAAPVLKVNPKFTWFYNYGDFSVICFNENKYITIKKNKKSVALLKN